MQLRSKGKKSLPTGLYLRQRQGQDYWIVQITVDGKKVGRGIGYVTRAEAIRRYPEVMADLRSGRPSSESQSGISLADFLAAYYLPMLRDSGRSQKTYDCENDNAGHLLAYFGPHKQLTAIDALDVEDFKQWRRNHGGWKYKDKAGNPTKDHPIRPTARTINLDLRVLRKALRYAKRLGIIDRMPEITNLAEKAERRARRWLTRHEMEAVLDAATEHRLLLTMAFHTGMRPGEVLSRGWADIDLERGEIRVFRSANFRVKKDSERVIPMTDLLRAELEAVPATRRVGQIFSIRALRSPLRHACRLAGVEPVSPNETRHTFATLAAEDGMERGALRDIIGHCDSKMLDEIYQHVGKPHVRSQMARLSWGRVDEGKVVRFRREG